VVRARVGQVIAELLEAALTELGELGLALQEQVPVVLRPADRMSVRRLVMVVTAVMREAARVEPRPGATVVRPVVTAVRPAVRPVVRPVVTAVVRQVS
jgi:hypothetical protein